MTIQSNTIKIIIVPPLVWLLGAEHWAKHMISASSSQWPHMIGPTRPILQMENWSSELWIGCQKSWIRSEENLGLNQVRFHGRALYHCVKLQRWPEKEGEWLSQTEWGGWAGKAAWQGWFLSWIFMRQLDFSKEGKVFQAQKHGTVWYPLGTASNSVLLEE